LKERICLPGVWCLLTVAGFIPYRLHASGLLVGGDRQVAWVPLAVLASLVLLILAVWARNRRLRATLRQCGADLQASEDKFRLLVGNSSDIVVIIDADGRQRYVSPVAEEITGYSLAELAVPFFEMIHPDDLVTLAPLWADLCRRPGAVAKVRYRHKHKSKGWIYLEAVTRNLLHEPAIRGVLSNVRDISESQQIQLDLQHALEQNRALLDANPDLMFVFSPDCRIVDCYPQRRIQELLRPAMGLVGRLASEVFPSELARLTRQKVEAVLGSRQAEYTTYSMESGGQTQWFEARYVLFGVNEVLAVVRDVSERVRLEEERSHLHALLMQSQKMESVGRLVGGVAHDFNNMLAGIMGATQLISLDSTLGGEVRGYADLILKTTERAAALTSRLLAFSRKAEITRVNFSVHGVIEDTVSILKRSLDRNIDISTSFRATQPWIHGDPAQLGNALLNMGINAAQAMPDGGSLSFLTMSLELDEAFCRSSSYGIEPGAYVSIEVRDSGSGIDPGSVGRIFEPFFTTKDPGQGTGLGLSAVFSLIKELHGAVTVDSQLGKGSSFRVYLPAGEVNAVAAATVSVKSGSGLVLLVDDEEIIRLTARKMLEKLGYQVLLAVDGQEAVRLYQANLGKVHAVLLDIVMPVMDGLEALRAILALDSGARFIIASGYIKEETLVKLAELGLRHYIWKPYSIAELSEALQAVAEPDIPEPANDDQEEP